MVRQNLGVREAAVGGGVSGIASPSVPKLGLGEVGC